MTRTFEISYQRPQTMTNTFLSKIEISVKYGDEIHKVDIIKELEVNHQDLDALTQAMASQPAKYAYFATLAVEATDRVNEAKHELKKIKKDVQNDVEDAFKTKSTKLTQKLLDHEVETDRRVLSAEKELRRLEKDKRTLDVVVSAFEQRKSMLQSVGAMIRDEKGGSNDVSTKTQEQKRREEQERDDRAVREAMNKRNAALRPAKDNDPEPDGYFQELMKQHKEKEILNKNGLSYNTTQTIGGKR